MRTLHDYHLQVKEIRETFLSNQPLSADMQKFIRVNGLYHPEEISIPSNNMLLKLLDKGVTSILDEHPLLPWFMWDVLQKDETDPNVYKWWRTLLLMRPEWNDLTSEELNDINHILYRHIDKKEIRYYWQNEKNKYRALFSPNFIQSYINNDSIYYLSNYLVNNESILWKTLELHLTQPAGNMQCISKLFNDSAIRHYFQYVLITTDEHRERWFMLFKKSWDILSKNNSKEHVLHFLCHLGVECGYPPDYEDKLFNYAMKKKLHFSKYTRHNFEKWVHNPLFAEFADQCLSSHNIAAAIDTLDYSASIPQKSLDVIACHAIYTHYTSKTSKQWSEGMKDAISRMKMYYDLGLKEQDVMVEIIRPIPSATEEINIVI